MSEVLFWVMIGAEVILFAVILWAYIHEEDVVRFEKSCFARLARRKNKGIFDVGSVLMGVGVEKMYKKNRRFRTFIKTSLGRHSCADYGELMNSSDSIMETNDTAIDVKKGIVVSKYSTKMFGEKKSIFVATYIDLGQTVILFAE